MLAKEAIEKAKEYAREIFAADGVVNLGLEELRFDDVHGIWEVTVGFTRGWDQPRATVGSLMQRLEPRPLVRTFKLVEVRDSDGEVLGVKHRPMAA